MSNKLTYQKRITETVETDIELPVYFYYQNVDEGLEEHVKWDGKQALTVTTSWHEFKIDITKWFPNDMESAIKFNLSDEAIFTSNLKEALEWINEVAQLK